MHVSTGVIQIILKESLIITIIIITKWIFHFHNSNFCKYK